MTKLLPKLNYYPGTLFNDLPEEDKEIIRNEVFEVGSSSFDSSQFQLILTVTENQFKADYVLRSPSVEIQGFGRFRFCGSRYRLAFCI